MSKIQANIIIILLALVFVGLAAVCYHLWNFRNEIQNYESNLRAYLETLK